MDQSAMNLMKWFIKTVDLKEDVKLDILDIGSYDVNGTYKSLFMKPKWKYTGLDIAAGKNVDIIATDIYHYPILDNSYDVVISGQCLEHVEDMYAWADEAIRILKPSGLMFISAPYAWHEHRYPLDCWRIFPDGMRWLFVKRTGKVKEVFINTLNNGDNTGHCYAIFTKPANI